jgi:hypothetical protein
MRSPQPPAYAGDGVTQVQGEKWEILGHHDTSEPEIRGSYQLSLIHIQL